MDKLPRKPVIPTLLAIAAVLGLLYLGNSVDFLSGVTKPAVVAVLNLVGIESIDNGDHLHAGHLEVPWTGDCAGLNILVVLVAVTLWANRHGPFGAAFWLRLLLALPVAYVANLARIFSLIGLRWLLYPSIETPSLHYFVGFLWVLPFLAALIRQPKEISARIFWLEILRIASILSLLAPFVSAPGGVMVAMSSLILLARHHWHSPTSIGAGALFCSWMAAGAFIAEARMESLWIPWLLVCPGYVDWRLSRLVPLVLLLPGTIPIFAMKPWAALIVIPAAIWEVSLIFNSRTQEPASEEKSFTVFAAAAVFHLFPFFSSIAAIAPCPGIPPPPGVMAIRNPGGLYNVRTIGQTPELSCFWYEPNEGGRHHTLEVCLQYRGIKEGITRDGELVTDGQYLYTEFFLMPGGELCSYQNYLSRTLLPFSRSGAHLIYMTPKEAMSREDFLRLSRKSAEKLAALVSQE